RYRDGRERVEHVVEPREIDLERERLAPLLRDDLEARAQTQPLDVVRAEVGALAEAVARDAPAELRDQLARVVVIAAEHGEPVERQVVQEIEKALLEPAEVSFVAAEVIRVDVRDDRN